MDIALKSSFLAVLAAAGCIFFSTAGCTVPVDDEPVGEAQQASLPASVDWRTKGIITPIRDQGDCQLGWAFAASDAISGAFAQKSGKLVELSPQELFDCVQKGLSTCTMGLPPEDAFEYVISKKGIEGETDYPYTGTKSTCQFDSTKVRATITSYKNVPANDQGALQAAVAVQPVVVALETDSAAFQSYKSGVFNDSSCGTTPNDYGLVVGYGVMNGKPYWLVKMAYGVSWGDQGYILIERGTGAGMCGIATNASYPVP